MFSKEILNFFYSCLINFFLMDYFKNITEPSLIEAQNQTSKDHQLLKMLELNSLSSDPSEGEISHIHHLPNTSFSRESLNSYNKREN